jgi:DNA invertase Pin-like site-specific DNA recombinase
MLGKFISYLRVSTDKQGRSGLGMDAQREAIKRYLSGSNGVVLSEYVEVESGKKKDRPQLTEALKHCKLTGAVLVIAKLDRLSRNAHFLLTLQEEGVKFVAADMPEANNLTVGIMAMVAQQEREAISKRTTEALQQKKRQLEREREELIAQGRFEEAKFKRLGNPNGAEHLRGMGNSEAVESVRNNADKFAESLRDTLEGFMQANITSARGMAQALNQRGILTARGGQWHQSTVSNLLKRLHMK